MKNVLPVVDGGTAQSWVDDKPTSTRRSSHIDLPPRSVRSTPPASTASARPAPVSRTNPPSDPPSGSRLRVLAFMRRSAERAWSSVRRDPS
jgi:hypothetical protein